MSFSTIARSISLLSCFRTSLPSLRPYKTSFSTSENSIDWTCGSHSSVSSIRKPQDSGSACPCRRQRTSFCNVSSCASVCERSVSWYFFWRSAIRARDLLPAFRCSAAISRSLARTPSICENRLRVRQGAVPPTAGPVQHEDRGPPRFVSRLWTGRPGLTLRWYCLSLSRCSFRLDTRARQSQHC